MQSVALLFLLAAAATPAMPGGDTTPEWGGFRGNNGAGLAAAGEARIPDRLDPEQTAQWRVEVPPGYSSPIVAGERVFLTAEQGQSLLTLAYDRATGETLWSRELSFDGRRVGSNSSAAPTPVTDGERLFVLFHATGLAAYDLEGELLWRRELGDINIPHGLASSPVLCDDTLLVVVDQDLGAYLVAIDTRNGEERWRAERPGVTHGYATPAIHRPAGQDPQVIVSGSLQVRAYSVDDGELIWWVDGTAWQTKSVPVVVGDTCYVSAYMVPSGEFGVPATQATFIDELVLRDLDGDGLIARSEWTGSDMLHQAWFIFDLDGDELLGEEDWTYLAASRRAAGGLFAIELGGQGNVTDTHVRWRYDDRRGLPDCPSPLVLGDTLYMIKEGGLLTALDAATGEVTKQGRVGVSAPYYASPVGSGDRLVTASAGGQLGVLRAGADWEVLSVAELGEELWSTPALADGQVIVRTQEALWCFESPEPEAAAGGKRLPW